MSLMMPHHVMNETFDNVKLNIVKMLIFGSYIEVLEFLSDLPSL